MPPPKPDKANEGGWTEQEPIWLCAGVTVVSLAVDEDGSWGKLLDLVNPDKQRTQWVMPFRLLAKKDELWQALLDKGLSITANPKGREALHAYLNSQEPQDRCTGNVPARLV